MVQTIANLFQEVGYNQFQSVGFSTDGFATTPTMRKLNLIWVTSRMHIEIYRYLAWGDVVGIKTWCQSEGRIGTRREGFLRTLITVKSLAVLLGFLLIIVCFLHCKWVMMNQDTRLLQKVSDDVRDEYLMFCPKEPRLAFPEEENNKSLKKILKLEDPAKYSIIGLKPRRIDLDMNHHVNNVTYIGWLLEVSVIIRVYIEKFACMRICMDSEVNSLRTNICNDFYPPRSPPHDLLRRNSRLHNNMSSSPAALFKQLDRLIKDIILARRKMKAFGGLLRRWLAFA
ncbi:hypothetical protein HID58_070466 [Brassica napus]|uniref:Acyl-[acyl-carrier-protein] hydrolase n=1 Tax=Brassica napus TaxID=3708 RepID=A0ABQ7YYU6_BRANA|nr:hypothetical protein HID58_070466 [Brassica napus]